MWIGLGISLIVEAGFILSWACWFTDPRVAPVDAARIAAEGGLVAIAFLGAGGASFYLGVRRFMRARREGLPGGPTTGAPGDELQAPATSDRGSDRPRQRTYKAG